MHSIYGGSFFFYQQLSNRLYSVNVKKIFVCCKDKMILNRQILIFFYFFNSASIIFFNAGCEGRGASMDTTFPALLNTMKRGIPVML